MCIRDRPQRKLHALTAVHLERELFDDLGGLHGARGEVERRRVFGVELQTDDGLLETGGVAGGDACQGYVLEAEEKAAGGARLGRAMGMQAVTQSLASVGELVEQHGDRHALTEAGAASHILEGGEQGGLVAAGHEAGQMRNGGLPQAATHLGELKFAIPVSYTHLTLPT